MQFEGLDPVSLPLRVAGGTYYAKGHERSFFIQLLDTNQLSSNDKDPILFLLRKRWKEA